jgi:hypothetical protein
VRIEKLPVCLHPASADYENETRRGKASKFGRQLAAKAAGRIEEDQQQRLPAKLRERFALAGQVRQLEGWRFTAELQTGGRVFLAELQFVQALLEFINPEQKPPVLAKQLPADPGAGNDGGPGKGKSDNHRVNKDFLPVL